MLQYHRDYRRNNKANDAVQATIMSKIVKSSLLKVKSILSLESNVNITEPKMRELNDAIDVSLYASGVMTEKFLRAQNEINVQTCKNYASQQFGIMKKATLNNEYVTSEQGISNNIFTAEMIVMTKKLFGCNGDQSGKYDIVYHIFSSF